MKPRSLAMVIVVLTVGAIAIWKWFVGEESPLETGGEPELPARSEAGQRSGSASNRAPSAPPALPSPGTRSGMPPGVPPPPAAPADPVRITSSVMPGLPVARTTPTPPRPPGAVPIGEAPQPVSRPERAVEGRAELENVQMMLRDFRTQMGENPVGTNAEIMKSVMGSNPKGANLGPPPGMRLNENGELVDQRGTAVFFHALSKSEMEIRSAGPDGVMWNGDDVVLK